MEELMLSSVSQSFVCFCSLSAGDCVWLAVCFEHADICCPNRKNRSTTIRTSSAQQQQQQTCSKHVYSVFS